MIAPVVGRGVCLSGSGELFTPASTGVFLAASFVCACTAPGIVAVATAAASSHRVEMLVIESNSEKEKTVRDGPATD